MSIRNLSALLNPQSLLLVGASRRPHSLGAIVLEKVLSAGFTGPVQVVNPHRVKREGILWAPSLDQIEQVPDLAIVMTPPATVPALIGELGKLGTKTVVVLTAGLTADQRQAMLDAAKPHVLRIVGPNCLGLVSPRAKLDATFARARARDGGLALISQSGALVTAMLDWAEARDIGFSGIISVGDMADVDVGDLLDLFATDPKTSAILLYVEGITDAAKFLSAARAAAIAKPVIAIKAGRSSASAKAAFSHTGALAGSYDVYLAAFERVGIVAVENLTELFDAAETLTHYREISGERLAIVTNGGGAGILAVDALARTGGQVAALDDSTISALDRVLPAGWARANPIDLIGDAGPERYRAGIASVLRDPNADALLVMNCPTALAAPEEFAAALTESVVSARREGLRKPVLACWLGDANAGRVREIMQRAGVPLYSSPEDAIAAFGYLLAARNAKAAMTDRPAASREVARDLPEVWQILASARNEQRTDLSEIEAKQLLAAYGVPVGPTHFASDAHAVGAACEDLEAPYAVKLVSPDVAHKSDVGGVVLDLQTPGAAAAAARQMTQRLAHERRDVRIAGFAVEEMVRRPNAHELLVGVANDGTFGPILVVGAGGTAVEVLADRALALPPIDHADALALIGKTDIAKRLRGFRKVPPANIESVAKVLDALVAMLIDIPEIAELDINPLLVDAHGAIALDARVRLSNERPTASRLAIRPAPMHWSADLATRSGMRFHVRPVRPDDEPLLAKFFEHVSPDDRRFRFLSGVGEVGHDRLAAMTRVDYRRTITFLAFDESRQTVIATAMLAAYPDRSRAEIALATRADLKGSGVSWSLIEHVLRYAKSERIGTVEAIEFADHEAALQMERELGFRIASDPEDSTLRIATLTL